MALILILMPCSRAAFSLVVILKPQMGDKFFAFQVA